MYSINQFQNTEVNRKYLCRIIFISVNKHFLATIARGQKKRYCSISKPHTVNAFLRGWGSIVEREGYRRKRFCILKLSAFTLERDVVFQNS